MLIGVVGKPNVGKSTFFKGATLIEVETAPYPFTTIKANEGVGFVRVPCPEKEFNVTCNPKHGFCMNGERFVPVRMLDVAGLVPGAHMGKGLGNKFLDDLRQADVLIHVIDAAGTTNDKGEIVKAGEYDPCKDVRFLEEELDAWFANIMKDGWNKFARQVIKGERDIAIAEQFSGLKINLQMVKIAMSKLNLTNKDLKDWTSKELTYFAAELRKVSKPIIIAANKMDLPTAKENIKRLKVEFPDYFVVPCSAESEVALRLAVKDELIKYTPGDKEFEILKEDVLKVEQIKGLELVKKLLEENNSTGVQKCLDAAVFELLKYIVIYPVPNAKLTDAGGNILPDALLLPSKSTALNLAYQIHTSIGEKFIRAIDIRKKQTIGKNHELKNGDVIEIISGK